MAGANLYNWIAPFYDPFLRRIYRSYREKALALLPDLTGATVLDLACGTGQNFPLLAARVGPKGRIVGVDISAGMLKRAAKVLPRDQMAVTLLREDAARLSREILSQAGVAQIDAVICTYGFTAMRDWETAFHRSYSLLQPGGPYLIHDMHAEKHTAHVALVETITRVDQSRHTWEPLQRKCHDFQMIQLDPSRYLFGGRLFAAIGTK